MFCTVQLILKVRQLESPILVPRRCLTADNEKTDKTLHCNKSAGEKCSKRGICYDLDVPEEYCEACKYGNDPVYKTGPGADNTDLLLFVSVAKVGEFAIAIHCQKEPSYKRSVVGRILVSNSRQLMPINRLKNVLLHELFHVILYPLTGIMFRKPYDPYSAYEKQEVFIKEDIKWISAHGVYLMAPIYSVGNQLCKLEVPIAVDSGWYEVNKSMGRELTVTRGKGCDFASMSCHEM